MKSAVEVAKVTLLVATKSPWKRWLMDFFYYFFYYQSDFAEQISMLAMKSGLLWDS